ncbi:MAG TPA: isocitrate lyase/PEP mutase family protein [Acidimicrobiales bacterium]|nr:isocitrate lyase/PEP mutase family protein [Acidimicrobiales bacterium]
MSAGSTLRRRLAEGTVVAPGAYDGLTAAMVADHGFPAVYMTGAGTSVAAGLPDYGLLTMTEMAANAARLVEASGLPVIADADTGYGNELNVHRTVRAYAAAGVAALHIEDQVSPKRCGHLPGKQVVPADEWLSKVTAAVEARPDPDLVVIARTDARAVADLGEAVRRANAALRAGADVAFVEAPATREEVEAVPRLVQGPCLFNAVGGGRSPDVGLAELRAWGYRLVILPLVLIDPVAAACDRALGALAADAGVPGAAPGGSGPEALFARVGAARWDELRARHAR